MCCFPHCRLYVQVFLPFSSSLLFLPLDSACGKICRRVPFSLSIWVYSPSYTLCIIPNAQYAIKRINLEHAVLMKRVRCDVSPFRKFRL
ncbi:uncharacterized protein BO96DRAFT_121977 [Aspergillus niger CBS 101883]|uniref:Secreted protein n=1 Tax=Aspergillus phoenicis ATCC 13157 TaxID=1353007 RepID=A0A370PKA9_ASPPH|nr:uncharacterized protein BO96DRAFT_121977 [Aspergillus niger CBS 101883]PYH53519.1 hypothetical protein BO96DRAFT_121977 [Aspergillus niger CBS 101883]RDK42627.1 hypothetical protein M752DRAFT_19028 [Aspergillus phoenicis ATCC 13157]